MYYDAVYNRGIRTEAPHLIFGTIVHEVLERWHKDPTQDILELYDKVWVENSLTDLSYYKEGREMIENYKNTPEWSEGTVLEDKDGLYLERYFRFPIDKKGEVVISGIIDRVDKLDDNTIEIIDYKTSRMPYTPDELAEDIQMSMYNIAANEILPEYENVKLSVLFLRYNKLTTDRTPEELEYVRSYLINTFYQIKYNEKPKPTLNRYCAMCPIKHQCDEWLDLTKEEKIALGYIPGDAEITAIWDELENIKVKQKILDDRRKEIEEALKTHLRHSDKEEIIIGNKVVKMVPQRRTFYPYDKVAEIIGEKEAAKMASISNRKVESAVKGDKKKQEQLAKAAVHYYTEPSLRVVAQKEEG